MGKIHLSFSRIEYAAITKLAGAMASADGKSDPMEIAFMTLEANRFNIQNDALKGILSLSNEMSPADAIGIVSKLDDVHKKYVTAYLGMMIAVDGDIDDGEIRLWQLVSTLANLPTMTIAESKKYMSEL